MSRWTKIDRAYGFLRHYAEDDRPFTVKDLSEGSGWTVDYARTNLSKRLAQFVRKTNGGYAVCPEYMEVRLDEFRDLFGQKRRLFAEYAIKVTRDVLVYELFMPLAHEVRLREALDNLFYLDTMQQRIREVGVDKIRTALGLRAETPDDDVKDLVLGFVETTLGGYSIYRVDGRFRAGELATRADVSGRPRTGERYLIDEMTAVVRFILPVETPGEEPRQMGLFEPPQISTEPDERAEQLRWLFLNVFAEAVVRRLIKEDEIWLLESGMSSALYRWVRKD